MNIAIMQPTYLPWLGYFQMIDAVDVFVLLDTVQFEKQSWQSRNRIIDLNGNIHWLSVPVVKHPLDTHIQNIQISQARQWEKKQLKTIKQILGKAPYFNELFPIINEILSERASKLSELNTEIIRKFSQMMEIEAEFILASSLQSRGKRTQLVRDICLEVGIKDYLSPAGACEYLEKERYYLDEADITVKYQEWEHPVYKQLNKKFTSHLSFIDTIANVGFLQSRQLIKKEN